MKKGLSIVGLDEALWRTGFGACVSDLVREREADVVRTPSGDELIDLTIFKGEALTLDVAALVLGIGTR